MSWSFPIGSFGGTVVRVHWTLVILLAWIGLAYYALGGPHAAVSGIIFILLIFVCVTLHEFGHVIAARRFGVRTPDIVLLPIGGASRMEEIPENPRQEAIVGIAGPIVSLLIAGLLIAAIGRLPTFADLAPEALAERTLPLPQLAMVNLILAAFNLLPAFPMDGGRVLRAALSSRMGRARATRTAARIGQGFAILFGLAALFAGNIILLLIAVFIFLAAAGESRTVRITEAARGMAASDGMISAFESLPADATVGQATEALIRTTQSEFPVVDGSGRLRGFLTRDAMIRALRTGGPDKPVAEAMDADIPTVRRSHALDRVLRLLQEGKPAVAVTGPEGQLVGYVTVANMLENLMVHDARP